jgi:putative membrane protein
VNLALTLPLADGWGMHDGDWGWMIVMMFVMLLFWAAVILGIVWLARDGLDRSRGGRKETPTEILDRRFAEGAISVEDYQERLKVLTG